MSAYQDLKGAVRAVNRALSSFGMFFLIPMMLITTAEVWGRALWNTPVPGSIELSSYMLVVFILLGVGATQQTKGHVRVEMFVSRLGQKARCIIEMATTLLSLVIIGLLAWRGMVMGLEETAVSDMLRIPQWPFRMLVAVAAASLFLELLIDLADLAKKFRS